MKYLSLPTNLIRFWYPDSLEFFIRIWKNLMSLLEEDLAVGLMYRLLFVPLFHDSSIVGRILSFFFRLTRIILGLFAYLIASLILLSGLLYWYLLPLFAILNTPKYLSIGLFLSALGLFLISIFLNPHRKVSSVRQIQKQKGIPNLWQASMVKKEDLSFKSLLVSKDAENLFSNLEIQLNGFPAFEIKDKDGLVEKAFELAKIAGSKYINEGHFLVAALENVDGIEKFLMRFELTLDDLKETLMYLEKKKESWRRVYIWDDDFKIHHLKGTNRGWVGVPTPNLDLASSDLTKEASIKGFPDLIRGNEVVKELVNILSQETGKNVILVGPAGSGKTALLRYLAKRIVTGDAPEALATKRLVLLDLTKLLSGVKTQGELAEKVKAIFEEVGYTQNVIFAIEEIHELGMGETGSSFNLYSLMQPYLESDSFQFIGTSENENYSRILEKNSSFARLFRKIEIPPATERDTLSILEDRAIAAERKDKIKVTFIAIKTAVILSKKFINDRVLPDSAISVLKEAMTQAVNHWVTKEAVRRVISSRVKVPLMEVGNADKNKLLKLEDEIHCRLIDQEQAVKAVADSLRRSVAGLREEKRPIGSFLFVGPTGVGKTELARTLSEVYFKTEGAFIRFDMSEYQNPESVGRLIGTERQDGQLTEAVRQRPYALLLLDEFEKADPKILTLFLQVLEDGRLTDASGRTVDFTNTIIIATSNAGSLNIAQGLEAKKSMTEIDKEVNSELLRVFKPELINRFDDVVLFKPLSQEDLQKIVTIKLSALQTRMKEKGFLISFEPELVAEFAKRGFDPVLGARPMRRLMQDTLEAKLSKLILQNQITKGTAFQAGVELLSA